MHDAVHISFFVVDFILVLLILSSNIGVLWVILKKTEVQRPKNALIISVAVADLCIGLFVIPNVMYMRNTSTRWKGLLCRLCLYFEYTSNAASVLSLAGLALDRFRAILFPLKSRAYRPVFLTVSLITIWIVAALYGLRAPLIYEESIEARQVNNATAVIYKCVIPAQKMETHTRLVVFDFGLNFVFPALTLLVCNVSISIKLNSKPMVHGQDTAPFLKRRKAIRLLMSMVIVFIVCHFPLYFYRMMKSVFKKSFPNASVLSHVFLIVSFLNSFLNVFFYGSLSDEVKSYIQRIGKSCRKVRANTQVHPVTMPATMSTRTEAHS